MTRMFEYSAHKAEDGIGENPSAMMEHASEIVFERFDPAIRHPAISSLRKLVSARGSRLLSPFLSLFRRFLSSVGSQASRKSRGAFLHGPRSRTGNMIYHRISRFFPTPPRSRAQPRPTPLSARVRRRLPRAVNHEFITTGVEFTGDEGSGKRNFHERRRPCSVANLIVRYSSLYLPRSIAKN